MSFNILTELLQITLEELSKSPDTKMTDIDQKLSDLVSDQNEDMPAKAFEQLFGMYEYSRYHGKSLKAVQLLEHNFMHTSCNFNYLKACICSKQPLNSVYITML